MIARQGGDPAVVDDYDRLPGARHRQAVAADRSGYVIAMNAELIGRSSMALGAGRLRVEDTIDYGAGVLIHRRPGEPVSAGEPVVELFYNDERGVIEAVALAREAITIAEGPPALRPLIVGMVR
jgi:thymidine phosphorylase